MDALLLNTDKSITKTEVCTPWLRLEVPVTSEFDWSVEPDLSQPNFKTRVFKLAFVDPEHSVAVYYEDENA